LGILRTLIENKLSLNINELIEYALDTLEFPHKEKYESRNKERVFLLDTKPYIPTFDKLSTQTLVTDFVFDRLKGYCLDKGYSADEFDAVMTVKPADPLDFMQRLAAVKAFRQLPEAESLAAANKRIRNILKKSESPAAATIGALVEAAEVQLLSSAKQSAVDIAPLLAQHDYSATLARLAALRDDVDAFFDSVMVMCDDLELRANRLALLNLLSEQFLTCADISKLQS
jgi:glycyl-tRNA synthetase beta chain